MKPGHRAVSALRTVVPTARAGRVRVPGLTLRWVLVALVALLVGVTSASRATAQQCGNTIVEAGEQCDDGNTVSGDGCDASCQLECHDTCVFGAPLVPGCNACVASICTADPFCCTVSWDEICIGETTSICSIPCDVCGNRVRESGEQCDDGNTISGDGCDSNCTYTACGNGIVTSGEECDDGNTVSGDGCDASCQIELCGNGVLDTGEQCDDGNTISGDGCEADCTFPGGFTAPFTQCPPIGPGTGCGALLEVTAAGTVEVLIDGRQVSYDGDDTLVGVHNSSNRPVSTIALSSNSVPFFDLDGDGLCTPLGAPAGCPFGPTGYEGPGVFFSIHGESAGIVYFAPAIQPGGIAYFSLEEAIPWGQLAAQLNPRMPFQCYRGSILAAPPPPALVSVTDAVTSFTAHVHGLRDFCTPTNEDGENPDALSAADQLESYALAPENPKQILQRLPLRRQLVANQFGLLLLDVTRPERLLVPTAESLTGPPPVPVSPAIDHFTCYKVKRSSGARAFVPIHNVRLADQLSAAALTVGKPTRLCLPANKNNETPGAETHGDRLLCYHLTGGVSGVGRVFVNNQFGSGIVYPRSRDELCVPSIVVAP